MRWPRRLVGEQRGICVAEMQMAGWAWGKAGDGRHERNWPDRAPRATWLWASRRSRRGVWMGGEIDALHFRLEKAEAVW